MDDNFDLGKIMADVKLQKEQEEELRQEVTETLKFLDESHAIQWFVDSLKKSKDLPNNQREQNIAKIIKDLLVSDPEYQKLKSEVESRLGYNI